MYVHRCVANDAARIHLLANAMNHENKVCDIHWAVILSSMNFIPSA